LRLSIGVELPSEVAGWPLEFLRCEKRGIGWLATNDILTLSRKIEFKDQILGLEPFDPPLKLLVVISEPEDLGKLITAQVVERIVKWSTIAKKTGVESSPRELARMQPIQRQVERQAGVNVRLLGLLENFEIPESGVDYLKRPATFANIREVCKDEEPHVFHFIGHGNHKQSNSYLACVDPTGKPEPDWLEANGFAQLFAAWSPRLVVLQACEGAAPATNAGFMSLASHLVEATIPAVVAMQYEIRNDIATVFASGFYEALAKGLEIDTAVQDGRLKITRVPEARWETPYFGIPVLFTDNPEGIVQPASTLSGVVDRRTPKVEDEAALIRRHARDLHQKELEALELGKFDLANKYAELKTDLYKDMEEKGLSGEDQSKTQKHLRSQDATGLGLPSGVE
jgi:hypothetical protein